MQCWNNVVTIRNNVVATLCCAKNRRRELSRVTSPLLFVRLVVVPTVWSLIKHSVATLLLHCFELLQHCSNIATLCCAVLRIVPFNITLKTIFFFIYQGWHAPVVSTIYARRQTHHHHHSCRKPKNRHDQNMGIIVSLYSLDQSDTYPLHLFLCTICQNCMVRPFTWWTVSGILWLTCTHPNLLFRWSL